MQGVLQYAKDQAEKTSVEGSQGYNSFKSTPFPTVQSGDVDTSARIAEKVTLGARQILPGTSYMDTTIPQKVQSQVEADYFTYVSANPENGIYNGMYLMDKQWEKEVKNRDPMAWPRSGDDQLYFPGFELIPEYRNQQPVAMELMDMFEQKLYGVYASHDYSADPLKTRRTQYDAITGQVYESSFMPEVSLVGDGNGSGSYIDPEQPVSSAEMNYLGMRPSYDSYVQPDEPSRFIPIEKRLSTQEQLVMNIQSGFAGWQVPLSYNTFPGVDTF